MNIRELQVRQGKSWTTTYTTDNETDIFKSLSNDLIAKKLCNCTYIRSIKRIQNYNGTITIIVTYDNETRSIYTIQDH